MFQIIFKNMNMKLSKNTLKTTGKISRFLQTPLSHFQPSSKLFSTVATSTPAEPTMTYEEIVANFYEKYIPHQFVAPRKSTFSWSPNYTFEEVEKIVTLRTEKKHIAPAFVWIHLFQTCPTSLALQNCLKLFREHRFWKYISPLREGKEEASIYSDCSIFFLCMKLTTFPIHLAFRGDFIISRSLPSNSKPT
eukprot:Sdes_comp20851_c0_seq2m17610